MTSASSDSRTNQIIVGGGWRRAAWTALAPLALAGCVALAPPSPPPSPAPADLPAVFVAVGWDAVPGWREDRATEAWPAFLAGCRALKAPLREAMQRACVDAASLDAGDEAAVKAFFEAHLSPYRVTFPDGRETGLFTGYYEPQLSASREKNTRFSTPLYGVPDDLLVVDLGAAYPELADKRVRGRLDGRRVLPYWTRAEIEAGRGPGLAQVIAWVEDPLDAFLLQVQGSGRLRLADGTTMRVGYADQNGRPYTAIGRVLVERGELTPEKATLPGIRAWAAAHPAEVPGLLAHNASYVFFRELPPPANGSRPAAIDGPPGSLGVPLLAGRTIAVDPRAIPLGAVAFVDTTAPATAKPLRRLVLAQDTGGAIRGAVRADVFWGSGAEAEAQAGLMREQGRLYLLWPRGAPLPAPAARTAGATGASPGGNAGSAAPR